MEHINSHRLREIAESRPLDYGGDFDHLKECDACRSKMKSFIPMPETARRKIEQQAAINSGKWPR